MATSKEDMAALYPPVQSGVEGEFYNEVEKISFRKF